MYGYGNSMFLATHAILARPSGGIDPDAQAFITAASITDPTQQSAINTLVTDLKGYNIWTKFKAIYPIMGGTAAQHKWNLKDPRDLDAAFRLTYGNGYTHSSTGMLPNGSSAYADTKFIANNHLTVSSGHISIYSRTNVEQSSCDFGGSRTPSAFVLEGPEQVILTRFPSLGFVAVYGSYNSNLQIANADSRGHFITNRNSVISTTGFKNGVKVINAAGTSGMSTTKLVISAESAAGPPTITRYSTREIAFASIGDGLSDTEAANFYTAVQAFQTTLNRQV